MPEYGASSTSGSSKAGNSGGYSPAEGNSGGNSGGGGAGATGGGTDEVFFLSDTNVTEDFTIPSGKNAVSYTHLTLPTKA